MKWHKIEIDDDVFQYLKKLAEPFEDTPNSVLRRELLKNQLAHITFPSQKADEGNTDHFPVGTPIALQQILDVVGLIRNGAYGRNDATRLIAKKHNVAPQTVQDKYGRQLGMTADEFDRLLDPSKYDHLTTLLIKKFPSHSDVIRKYLKA